ncbi:hypothetical protein QQS21_003472 [Conoideocrella luteorostrata]|uniref:Uncharacterized protein n=1 Tax=Conoideocrella luteorostrata TaxID=1105319 RepID=A0AAJ0FVI1_9HYPO|nr:hypothetical protein QQS21_003472 [Conoideocrella luteorostrata]
MAQTTLAPSTLSSGRLTSTKPSDREVFELDQYEKIVKIRDAIISGKRTAVTLPPSSSAPLEPLSLPKKAPKAETAPALRSEDKAFAPKASVKPAASGRSELNPIFLEKSDELIRAELQIQRRRLESALKEEVEQRRFVKTSRVEPSSELDLSDVLAKALVLVQAADAPAADGETLTANAETTSDSLDESTFYSSRHDTPESHLTSRIRNSSQDIQATNFKSQHGDTPQQTNKHTPPRFVPAADTSTAATHPPAIENNGHTAVKTTFASQMSIVPGLNNYVQVAGSASGPSQSTRAAPSQSDEVNPSHSHQQATNSQLPPSTTRPQGIYHHESHPPSPLVRNHTLQPIAPQPTHPSCLNALASASSAVVEASRGAEHRSAVGTPAQVVALRTEQNIVTSPDSSSQGGKKKGKKKKKRKADRQGADAEAAPYIKPEPRSPSLLHAQSFIRPSKRQRHTQDPSAVHEYEPRYDPANVPDAGVQYVTQPVRDHTLPIGHVGAAGYPERVYSSATTGTLRYNNGQYYDDHWIPGEEPLQRQGYPGDQQEHFSHRSTQSSRPASRILLAEPYPVGAPPYREFRDGSSVAAHPDAETFIAPPRPAPTRILVDAYGREYIEPPHRPPSHLPVASPSRHGEREVVYERFPLRSLSRHPAPGPYEDDGIVYAPPSRAYALPRRIVTQPEYTTHDYRDASQREVSSRQPPGQGEFVQVLAPQERRYGDDGYGARPTSVRPVETVRYQMPPDYGRVHSVRPELQNAPEYRASVHPDGHHEVLQPYRREYRSGPAQEPVMPRGFSVRPAERDQSGQLRGAEEIAFIERPNGTAQEMIYASDARREVYR